MATKSIFKKWWFWLIAIVIVVIIFSNIGNPGGTPTPTDQTQIGINTPSPGNQQQTGTPTPPATPTATAKDDMIKAGMYKVGPDIPAGEYLIFANNNTLSYYQVTKDSSGTLESIISNDNFSGTRYITVSDGQYIETREATMYPIDKAPTLSAEDNKYPEGMYKVGRDIAAGEYKAVPSGAAGSYVEVAKDSKGLIESIVSNDNFTTEKYVTIADGQYIKLVGCYLTTK